MLFLFYYRCYNYGNYDGSCCCCCCCRCSSCSFPHYCFHRCYCFYSACLLHGRPHSKHSKVFKHPKSFDGELGFGCVGFKTDVSSVAMPDATTGTACSCSYCEWIIRRSLSMSLAIARVVSNMSPVRCR